MLHLSEADSFLLGYLTLRTLSSAVSSMPPPRSQYGFYAWLHGFLHSETANLDQVFATRFPNISTGPKPEGEK